MAKVLVIDDERNLAHVIRLLLEQRGHDMLLAEDGSRGIATAQRQCPDAIIMDLMMPIMDGFAALEALTTNEKTASIPIVIATAMQGEQVEERCYRMGAKHYIRKPFDARVLIGMVEEAAGVLDPAPIR